jgi:hypothetical protein
MAPPNTPPWRKTTMPARPVRLPASYNPLALALAAALADEDRPLPVHYTDVVTDDRVSYSKVDGKYFLENDDGTEWEWDGAMGWVPSVWSSLSGYL